MARLPKTTDFYIDVEGEGRFRIGKRDMKSEMEIQREYASFAGGVEPTVWLETLSEYLSTLRVLIVEGPETWDMDNMDPLDNDTYTRLGRVFVALREREESFRARHNGAGQGTGAGSDSERSGAGEPVVSQDVSPATE